MTFYRTGYGQQVHCVYHFLLEQHMPEVSSRFPNVELQSSNFYSLPALPDVLAEGQQLMLEKMKMVFKVLGFLQLSFGRDIACLRRGERDEKKKILADTYSLFAGRMKLQSISPSVSPSISPKCFGFCRQNVLANFHQVLAK